RPSQINHPSVDRRPDRLLVDHEIGPDGELGGDGGEEVRSDAAEPLVLHQYDVAPESAHEPEFESHVRVELLPVLAAAVLEHREAVPAAQHVHAEVVPKPST